MSFPSKEQEAVINFSGPRLVVVAHPGTGKTTTIVERLIRLLQENANREISFITFTRSSRRDTKRKVESALASKLDELTVTELPRLSTLYTYAKAFDHRYSNLIGRSSNFSVLVAKKGEKDLILDEVITDSNVSIDVDTLRKAITYLRSTGKWPDNFGVSTSDAAILQDYYERLLLFYNTLDIEGLVTRAIDIINLSEKAVPLIYLQVDEYQDLNPMDQKFIKLLASSPKSQIVVVGDDAQSIYSFRHADYTGLRELWESSEWAVVQFTNCHRLPPHIQNVARRLIVSEDYLGTPLEIAPVSSQKIKTLQCTKAELQPKAVGRDLLELKKTKTNRDGNPLVYKDFLILCPIMSQVEQMSSILENEFRIPTRKVSKPSIPDDHWRLLLVLRMLNYSDSLALRQWLEISSLNIQEITELRGRALDSNQTLYAYCATVPDKRVSDIYQALKRVNATVDDFAGFQESLLSFPNLLIEQDLFPKVGLTIDEATKQVRSLGDIIKSIYEKFGLIDPDEEIPDEDKVLVTTLHSAKGLEAEYVFICWMNSRYLPMPGRDEREEKRVLYVALTRAKQDVILTFHEEWDRQNNRRLYSEAMSSFLHEIRDFLDIRKVSAKDLS